MACCPAIIIDQGQIYYKLLVFVATNCWLGGGTLTFLFYIALTAVIGYEVFFFGGYLSECYSAGWGCFSYAGNIICIINVMQINTPIK